MIKYKILLIDDEIYTDDNRKNVFAAFLENEWFEYYRMRYQEADMEVSEEQIKKAIKIYDEVGWEFEVTYTDSISGIRETVDKIQYDAIFMDALFDRATTKIDFKDVLAALQRYTKSDSLPIFVYSAKLEEVVVNRVNNAFYEVFEDRTPNRYYTFSEIDGICEGARKKINGKHEFGRLISARRTIHKIISKSKNEVAFNINNADQLSILHISDLQFGDPKTSQALNGILNNIVSKVGPVDLLIITGDIAMRGLASEFTEAKKFINALRKKLWKGDNREQERKERTIIIPGNHDYDLNTTILPYFVTQNRKTQNSDGNREIDIESVVEQITKKKCDEKNSYSYLGLQAYRNFAFEMTGDTEYIINKTLNFKMNKYMNWGISFYCLNSVGNISAKETNKVYLPNCGDEYTTEQNILSIVLCHHTPLSTEPNEIPSKDREKFCKALAGYITGNGCRIVMGGHSHKNESMSGETKGGEKYIVCTAASLRVEGDCESYIRGFKKYIFHKEKKLYSKMDEEIYVIDEKDSSITKQETRSYDILPY